MPSNHLILCHPLLFLTSIFPRIGVFSNELTLHIMWSKYWSFSFSISPSNEYSELISLGWTGLISLLGLPRWHNCKESDRRDMSSIPGSGRFPGVGNGNLLQYSLLEISMDRVNPVVYSPWGHKKLDTTE